MHPPRDRVPSVRDDDAAFRLVELSDGEVRVDRWDGSGSAWVPVPGARLGVIRAGSKLSPAELEARGIHRRTR